MNDMHLRNVDLNLLPILTTVVEDRSVTIAADRLGMTQSAVSQALARMRKLWKDPLLVRIGTGMQPTPYALELTRKFGPALDALVEALEKPSPFDPAKAARTYTISISGGGDDVVLPSFMGLLAREAPDVSLSTLAATPAELERELEDGRVDLVIDYVLAVPGEKTPSPRYNRALRSAKIFEENLVILDTAALSGSTPISREDYAARRHVGFTLPVTRTRALDRSLARQGISRDIRFRVPTSASIPAVVEATASLATIPARFAANCERHYEVRIREAAFPLPRIAIYLVWHSRTDNDPAESWLREKLMEIITEPEHYGAACSE